MERIGTLLEKISKLSKQGDKISQIDIDLMLDYTRVLYADLQEWKERVTLSDSIAAPADSHQATQPTLQGSKFEKTTRHGEIDNIPQTTAHSQTAPKPEPEVAPIPTFKAEPPVTVSQPKEESPSAVTPTPSKEEFVLSHPAKDIRKNIGINDKYLFISELFSNDKEAYENIVEELNSFDDYQEAVDWLDNNIYSEYQWDNENETVQLFYSVLNNFFSLT